MERRDASWSVSLKLFRAEDAESLLGLSSDLFLVLTPEGRIASLNRKGCELLGWKEEELAGRDWFETCTGQKDREKSRDLFRRIIAGEAELPDTVESAVLARDGRERVVTWRRVLVRDDAGAVVGLIAAGRDETLERLSAERYRALLDLAADMIWIRDLDTGAFLEVNAAVIRTLGYGRKDLLGRPIYDLYFDEKDRMIGMEFALTVLQRGSAIHTATLRTRDGRPLEVEMRGSLMEFTGRKASLVIARPISEEVARSRRALILYEAFRSSNDVMFYADRNGVILDINDAFTQHYGFTREETLGQTPRLLRSRHSTDDMYKRMWDQILDPTKGFWRGELINRTKEGREIPVLLTITSVRDQDGKTIGYVSNAVDLSEQIALQSRVAHSEALASLGEMAAVVAHEIRNPLGSIVMAARQLSAGRLGAADKKMVLDVLRDESQRLNETLTNFLSFARPRDLKLERSDLNALLQEVLRMIQSNKDLLGSIKVRSSFSAKLDPFPMDPDQIRQVFWNIALNGIQAMDGRGVLTVETGYGEGRAYFRVRDTGPGIPDAARAVLFKPFQTTKRQGTGLGLAIAERIVKSHGGRIDVDSRPGAGTAFTVRLPALQE